jgi:hypothetical protein
MKLSIFEWYSNGGAYTMRYLVLLLTGFFLLTDLSSCKKKCYDKSNPDCENYDPCFGQTATNADFKQQIMFGDKLIDIDTFAGPIWDVASGVTFTAIQNFDSCWWEHGLETIVNEKQFFRLNYPVGKISTQLILKRQPNNKCYPFDKGKDTVEKSFIVAQPNKGLYVSNQANLKDTIDWPLIFGTYEGYVESNPNIKRIVKIGVKYYCTTCPQIDEWFWLSGLPYQNSRPIKKYDQLLHEPPNNFFEIQPTGMFFKYGHQVENVNFLYELRGTAFLQKGNTNKLVFAFSYIDSTGYTKKEPQHSQLKRITDRFIGTKIDNRFLDESTSIP